MHRRINVGVLANDSTSDPLDFTLVRVAGQGKLPHLAAADVQAWSDQTDPNFTRARKDLGGWWCLDQFSSGNALDKDVTANRLVGHARAIRHWAENARVARAGPHPQNSEMAVAIDRIGVTPEPMAIVGETGPL